uniref:G-protein coupled receptors family 1 profile domain-containing protein n=1 Tax=Timema genevievae TaxID=629358 RepID=A0A7R9JQJ6_TIMGE|nr:unnamed protein product [Timema genevievae]
MAFIPDKESNLDFPLFGNIVYCEGSALEHAATEEGDIKFVLENVVKMLAMVVFVFATLWLPYRGMLVYNSFAMLFSRKRFMDLWFLMFAKTCIYINWYAIKEIMEANPSLFDCSSAINPILYSMMSAKFRRAFHRVLCGTGPLNNHDTPYTSTRNFSTSTRSSSRKHCSRSSSMSMKKTSGFKRGTSERNRRVFWSEM